MSLLDIRGQITFLYFDDMPAACDFFANTLGLPLTCDQGWSKIYQLAPTAFVGAVDRSRGACKATTRDGALTTLIVTDFDEMCNRVKEKGYEFDRPPHHAADINVNTMMFYGPEGYKFEVEEFLDPELRKIFYPNL